MQITTERLLIRPMRMSDLDRFDPLANSDFVLRYLCMYRMDREGSREYIRQMMEKKKDFAIALRESDELIGKIHIDEDHLRYDVNSVDLAYWLGEEYTRKGYMTEALTAFLDYLFREREYDIVSASALAPNIASCALLCKLGFTKEGVLRRAIRDNGVVYDSVLFSLMRDEFLRSAGSSC